MEKIMYKVAIITASDKGSAGHREDKSGSTIKSIMKRNNYSVEFYQVLPDEKEILQQKFIHLADEVKIDLILTTGGTGFSKRDVTPEATIAVIDRNVPGIPEAMRQYSMQITKRAMLSRAVAGIRGQTLIVNLPGSPKAVEETLAYIIDELRHGLDILKGNDGECARK